jgi:hypothetical protein
VLTAEPLLDVLAEFSGEWLDGAWCGVTQYVAENMRWSATWVRAGGDPGLPPEVRDFVFEQRAVERALAALDVPRSCGVATCGVDCAVARGAAGGLEVRPLELNARTTMSHYAHAARRRVPGAQRLDVLRVAELAGRADLVPLTDPEGATHCAAVLVLR